MVEDRSHEHEAGPDATGLSLLQSLRMRLCILRAHRARLWRDVSGFAGWYEDEVAPVAADENESEVVVELARGDGGQSVYIGAGRYDHDLGQFALLWAFLRSLGIETVHLDARLERNQIEDVLGLLYGNRDAVKERSTRSGVVARLLDPQGLSVACTQTSLQGHTLKVLYTYCTLRFSRVVHWFEERHRRFHDHRTLFHAAPRYGALITLVFSGPPLALALWHREWALAAVLVLAGLGLFGLMYGLFMIVGSVEYDNEEKAYNLGRAYGRLRRYTEMIQADIQKARAVQEAFIPAPETMPFQDRLDWAASFAPAVEVGGDYFDVAQLDDERVAILFSDVSGHGMGAAFITAIMKTTFRAWLDNGGTLEELASQMNANLSRLVPLGSFAAAFLAIYDVGRRELVYANCGHQPEPWRVLARGDRPILSLSDARNMVMGIVDSPQIATSTCTLELGDMLLLVSDGIVENPDVDGDIYGAEKFEAFVQGQRELSTSALVEIISEEARVRSSGMKQSDDRTVLAFRIVA